MQDNIRTPTPDDYLVEVISVKTADLFVDHQYQRMISPGRVKYLVNNWNWRRYFPIIVGHRRDRYAVIDGQQRFNAAVELGIEKLPAILVVSQSLEDEAELFLGANTAKPVGAGDRFRARLVIKDPKALQILELVRAEGFDLSCARDETHSRDPFWIDAVYAIERIIDVAPNDRGWEYLRRTLAAIRDAWGDRAHADLTSAAMLSGMYQALRHMDRFDIPQHAFVEAIRETDPKEVTEKSYQRYQSMVGNKSIPAAVASVLVEVFNAKKRRDKIPAYSGRALSGTQHEAFEAAREAVHEGRVERGPSGRFKRVK